MGTRRRDGRKTAQPFDVRAQCLDQRLTQTHHHCRVDQLHQRVERCRHGVDGLDGEKQMACLQRHRCGKNARLVLTHMNSFKKAA